MNNLVAMCSCATNWPVGMVLCRARLRVKGQTSLGRVPPGREQSGTVRSQLRVGTEQQHSVSPYPTLLDKEAGPHLNIERFVCHLNTGS